MIASIELTAISPSPDHSCVSPLSTAAPRTSESNRCVAARPFSAAAKDPEAHCGLFSTFALHRLNSNPQVITRHGRPVAALVPISAYGAAVRQRPLLPLKGSGRGLWGGNSTETIREMGDEWSR